MRRHLSIGMIAAACLLAGCGGSDKKSSGDNGYPAVAQTNFVNACSSQPGATKSKCTCVYEKIRAEVPFDQFKKADTAAQSGGSVDPAIQAKITAAVKACR